MAHSRDNITEQNSAAESVNSDSAAIADAFATMLQSYRQTSEQFRQVAQEQAVSDTMQRAANSLGTSTTEALTKMSGSLSEMTETIKKVASPQIASQMALQASAEIMKHQHSLLDLQRAVIPSSGTIAAASRLVATSERTQKMIEWLSGSNEITQLAESLKKMSTPVDIPTLPKISALQSISEHLLSAQKLMGTAIIGLVKNHHNLSPTTDPSEEAQ